MIKDKIKELESLTSYLKDEERKKIIEAINFSEIAHKNQTRKSGDPFIIHPIKVAKIADTQIDKIIATGIENAPKLCIFIKSD